MCGKYSKICFVLLLVTLVCCGNLFAWPWDNSGPILTQTPVIETLTEYVEVPVEVVKEVTIVTPDTAKAAEMQISIDEALKQLGNSLTELENLKNKSKTDSAAYKDLKTNLSNVETNFMEYDKILTATQDRVDSLETELGRFHFGIGPTATYSPSQLTDFGLGITMSMRKADVLALFSVTYPGIVSAIRGKPMDWQSIQASASLLWEF